VPDATSIRKEVASVLGIGEATLARVVAEHNSSKNEKFSERSERRMQGRPRKSPDHNVVDLIHRFVMTANTSGSPLSTHLLQQKLEEHGYILSKGQLRVILGFWKRSLDRAKEYENLNDDILLVKSDSEDLEVEEIDD